MFQGLSADFSRTCQRAQLFSTDTFDRGCGRWPAHAAPHHLCNNTSGMVPPDRHAHPPFSRQVVGSIPTAGPEFGLSATLLERRLEWSLGSRDTHNRSVEMPAGCRAMERGVIGEHPAVGGDEVVAGPVGCGADTHDRTVAVNAAGRAVERSTVREDATVGTDLPVAAGRRVHTDTHDGCVQGLETGVPPVHCVAEGVHDTV